MLDIVRDRTADLGLENFVAASWVSRSLVSTGFLQFSATFRYCS